MSIKAIVSRQYREKVNNAVKQFSGVSLPLSEGWIRTVRRALGMSGSQLAKRLGVTKGRISQAEAAEVDGGITLKTMKKMAEAMNCRFVYAVVPDEEIEHVLRKRAIEKAKSRVDAASTHMALEDQALDSLRIDSEVERIASEIAKRPSDLWNDE